MPDLSVGDAGAGNTNSFYHTLKYSLLYVIQKKNQTRANKHHSCTHHHASSRIITHHHHGTYDNRLEDGQGTQATYEEQDTWCLAYFPGFNRLDSRKWDTCGRWACSAAGIMYVVCLVVTWLFVGNVERCIPSRRPLGSFWSERCCGWLDLKGIRMHSIEYLLASICTWGALRHDCFDWLFLFVLWVAGTAATTFEKNLA